MMFLLFTGLLASATASAISGSPSGAQEVNRTTSFIKVIKTDDVEVRDAIYTTPPVIMIGKRDGNILRCLQQDLNDCEVFYKSGLVVRCLVVSGEYLYAGLDSGVVLKCDLNIKESCRTLHKHDSDVHGLFVEGGYLYVGLYKGTILRCDLSVPDSCRSLHELNKNIYSLFQSKGYIYAGLWDKQIIKCSFVNDDSCRVAHNMTSGIMSLIYMGNSITALTYDGRIWNCSDTCESVPRTGTYTESTAIAQFSGLFYVIDVAGLHVCKQVNDTNCVTYEHHENSWSMAFVYKTYHMQSRYRNEHTTCTWQSNSKCPPFVTYYDVQERYMLEVNVRDGRLYNAQGFLVDTTDADEGHYGPAAIFAMGPDGTLLLSNSHKRELLHTASLFAGNPVSGVGEMVVKNGVIVKLMACSEHYRPDLDLNQQVVQSLLAQGYQYPIYSEVCGANNGFNQTELNYVQ